MTLKNSIQNSVQKGKKIIKDNAKALVVTGGLITMGTATMYAYQQNNWNNSDDIRIKKLNHDAIVSAESARKQIEWVMEENISTLLVLDLQTGQVQPLYTATRFLTEYQPVKPGINSLGDIVSQNSDFGKKYARTLTLNEENFVVYNQEYNISRTLGDLVRDADDYEIYKNNSLDPNLRIIATYSPSHNNNIVRYNIRLNNEKNSFQTIQKTQQSTIDTLNQN